MQRRRSREEKAFQQQSKALLTTCAKCRALRTRPFALKSSKTGPQETKSLACTDTWPVASKSHLARWITSHDPGPQFGPSACPLGGRGQRSQAS
ncbi:hypothetical protein WJX74_009617 [Apatococcus lobatus]|uniref:Uncharacterized protein n=1 Tax=Apatococcus lobatus TaxID=904363 RepID=A0AAW1R2B6_9CHLO